MSRVKLPFRVVCRMLFSLLWVIQILVLQSEFVGTIKALFSERSGFDSLTPLEERGEFLDLHPTPKGKVDPGKVGDIGYRVLVTNEPISTFFEMLFQDSIETSRLVLISVNSVLNLLWCLGLSGARKQVLTCLYITEKVISLSLVL